MDHFISKPLNRLKLSNKLAIFCDYEELDSDLPDASISDFSQCEDPVFDLHKALENAEFSIPVLEKMTTHFIETIPVLLKEVDEQLKKEIYDELGRISNTIMDEAGKVGAVAIYYKSKQLKDTIEAPTLGMNFYTDLSDAVRSYKEKLSNFNWKELNEILKK
ncbi:MAG: hypothetical protein HRT89_14405 [Lentisphaeria bacterium]|nr:hypothetical protein [Lentisphaeria bacterium]